MKQEESNEEPECTESGHDELGAGAAEVGDNVAVEADSEGNDTEQDEQAGKGEGADDAEDEADQEAEESEPEVEIKVRY